VFKKIYLSLTFALMTSLLFFSSCRGGSIEEASTTEKNNNAPEQEKPAENSAGFNIQVQYKDNTGYSYVMHKGDGSPTDDFNAPCVVDNAALSADIKCVVEAKELDLYYNGVGLRFNVPQNMCEYLSVNRPAYYNFLPGDGPTTVIDNRTNSLGSVTINGITAAAGQLKVGTATKTSMYCDFDYMNSSNPNYKAGAPNCCVGDFDLYTASVSGSTVTVSPAQKSNWGGKYANCLAGSAMQRDNANNFLSTGYPIAKIYNVLTNGLNSAYFVTSPYSLRLSKNVYAANFFKPSEHPTNSVPVSTAAVGNAVAVNPYHEFVCYGRSQEIKARIRVLVREWNSDAEYNLGATGDPDSTGNESGFGGPAMNDFLDFLDILDTATSYPMDVAY